MNDSEWTVNLANNYIRMRDRRRAIYITLLLSTASWGLLITLGIGLYSWLFS